MTDETRTPTATDAVADAYVETLGRLSPSFRTMLGLEGDESELDDFSPAGLASQDAERTAVLGKLSRIKPEDDVDVITQAAMRERLALEGELYDSGEQFADLNVIASPLQGIRDIFDLMSTDSAQDWDAVAGRMANVPGAIAGYIESLREGADTGLVPARRQVEAGIAQAVELAEAGSFWGSLAERGAAVGSAASLADGAEKAKAAYGELAAFLRDELAPRAPEKDAVGRDRYSLFSQTFLGATIDLDETYEWGLEELGRIVAEQEATAAALYGAGTTPEEAMAKLDADPSVSFTEPMPSSVGCRRPPTPRSKRSRARSSTFRSPSERSSA